MIGYKSQEIPVNNRSIINVNLGENEERTLREVVVIGYGTTDRRTLATSVSSIGSKDIRNDPLPSITQAIQGKAGGVQVTQRGGSPGGGVNIRIRGTTSINASSEPLYVVDGIPVNSTTNFVGASDYNLGGGTQGINILASLNPSDIESVEVLKDAAATSIYGARAANGVVLITTKRGTANSSTISLNAYSGISEIPRSRWYKLMETPDYISYMQDYYAIRNTTPIPDGILRSDVNTNWQQEMFRTAPIHNYELSARGGSDKTQYFTSLGYYNQEGTILNSGFDRIGARINLDHKFNDKLKFSTNFNFTRAMNRRIQEENSNQGATKNGLTSPPNLPVYNPDGTFAVDPYNVRRENQVAFLTRVKNTSETFRILGNVAVDYQPVKNLTFRTSWGADMSYIDEQFFIPPTGIRNFEAIKGLGAARSTKDQLWLTENTLTFDQSFGPHHLNVLGGFSFQQSTYSFVDARRTNFASASIPVISAGGTLNNATSSIQEWAIVFVFRSGELRLQNQIFSDAELSG